MLSIQTTLRKSMFIPASKKELVVLKNESFTSQTMVNPQSRNAGRGHRATLSSIILSKQLKTAQQIPNLGNLTQISEDTMSNSNEYSTKRTIDSSLSHRKNPFRASDVNDTFNNNFQNVNQRRNNHKRSSSCEYERGVVEFYKSPIKKHNRSYSIEHKEKKYDNPFCIKKIIQLQANVRKYILRRRLFNMIMSYYKSKTFLLHLENMLAIRNDEEKYEPFHTIKKAKKRSYFVTRKQLNLLEELKKRKITNIKELNAYLDWLEKTKL